jgi:electron transport complex protein RnfG
VTAAEAGPARMMVTLGVAGLASGLALVGIFVITQPRIERNRAEALEAALYRVLPGSASRKAFVVRDGVLTPMEGQSDRLPDEEAIYAGYDQAGMAVGFAIPAEGPGFQDTIKLIYGYDPVRRRVVGMEVLESKETPGLGDKIIKDEEFVAGFRDLAVTPEVVAVRRGRTQENEIDAISGATISSIAVARIINEANARWLERLPDLGAPAAAPPASRPEGAGEHE